MRPKVEFHWRGNHHVYYGIFFAVFGLFNVYMGWGNSALVSLMPLWWIITGMGAVMITDDVIEHTITADTPLRILYRFLFKVNE